MCPVSSSTVLQFEGVKIKKSASTKTFSKTVNKIQKVIPILGMISGFFSMPDQSVSVE